MASGETAVHARQGERDKNKVGEGRTREEVSRHDAGWNRDRVTDWLAPREETRADICI